MPSRANWGPDLTLTLAEVDAGLRYLVIKEYKWFSFSKLWQNKNRFPKTQRCIESTKRHTTVYSTVLHQVTPR